MMVGIRKMFYMPGINDPRVTKILTLLERKKRTKGWLAGKLKEEITVYPAEVRKWLDPANGEAPKIKKYTEGVHVYDRMLKILQGDAGGGRVAMVPNAMRDFVVYATGSPKERVLSRLMSTESLQFPYDGESDIYGLEVQDDFMSSALKLGDIAVMEVVSEAKNGEVVHFYRKGEDLIACLRVIDDVVWAYPFNDDCAPFACPDWEVHGRCIGARRPGEFGIVSLIQFPKGLKWSMKAVST